MGELPVNDLIRVVVPQQDVENSLDIIKKWQQDDDRSSKSHDSL